MTPQIDLFFKPIEVYHDRTNLVSVKDVRKQREKNRGQNKDILEAFKPGMVLSARMVRKQLKSKGNKILLSSVRRGLTGLKKEGLIVVVRFTTGAKKRPVYYYQLNERK